MKRIWPPPHAMRVGFEPNQHGHAAEQLHASSSCPTIFHGAFGASAVAGVTRTPKTPPPTAQTATSPTMNDFRMVTSFGGRVWGTDSPRGHPHEHVGTKG